MTILKRSTFLGASTVGERGQVVIPAEARRELAIATGDKILFFGHPKQAGLFLFKAEMINDLVSRTINNAIDLEKLLSGLGNTEGAD